MVLTMNASTGIRWMVSGFVILIAMSIADAQAPNVTGRWEFKTAMPDGQQRAFFILELANIDNTFTGDFVGPIRPFGTAKPTNLSFDGKELKFKVTVGDASLYFTGSWIGDHFEGIASQNPAQWLAMRAQISDNNSPEETAYKQALTVEDPRTRIKALERFITENPKSELIREALSLYLLASSKGAGGEVRKKLEALYRRAHSGKLDGLHEMVDKMYSTQAPRFDPGVYRTGRVVIIESFTGTGCPPCVAADAGLGGVLQRYGRDDVVVLNYHTNIPAPDPMANADAEQRLQFYGVNAVPTVYVDGAATTSLGGPISDGVKSFNILTQMIERRLAVKPDIKISLNGSINNSMVNIKCEISKSPEAKALKLRLALVERTVHYSGENGIHFHHYVVRDLIDSADDLMSGVSGTNTVIERSINLTDVVSYLKSYLDSYEVKNPSGRLIHFSEKKHGINVKDLAIVAFVQNDLTKEILQAQYLSLK